MMQADIMTDFLGETSVWGFYEMLFTITYHVGLIEQGVFRRAGDRRSWRFHLACKDRPVRVAQRSLALEYNITFVLRARWLAVNLCLPVHMFAG